MYTDKMFILLISNGELEDKLKYHTYFISQEFHLCLNNLRQQFTGMKLQQ